MGIGTASPDTKLDVSGTTRANQLNVALLCDYDGQNCKQVDANAQIIVKSKLSGTTRAEWNNLVTYAASKRSNLVGEWQNDCRYDSVEQFPAPLGYRLDNCALWICRTHFPTGSNEIAQVSHCGSNGDANCPTENYEVRCFY